MDNQGSVMDKRKGQMGHMVVGLMEGTRYTKMI